MTDVVQAVQAAIAAQEKQSPGERLRLGKANAKSSAP